MNDAPDSEAQRLVSRRTVAKTAAWAAPAIALAAASPAHATSTPQTSTGMITFGEATYNIPEGYVFLLEGRLEPTDGNPVPADFLIAATVPQDGFTLMGEPSIRYDEDGPGASFTLYVLAEKGGARGTVTAASALGKYADTWLLGTTTLVCDPPVAPLPEGTPRIFFPWVDSLTPYSKKSGSGSGFTRVKGQIRVAKGHVLPDDDMLLRVWTDTDHWQVYATENPVSMEPGKGVQVTVTRESDTLGTFEFDVLSIYGSGTGPNLGFTDLQHRFLVVWESPQIVDMAYVYVDKRPLPVDWKDSEPDWWEGRWA